MLKMRKIPFYISLLQLGYITPAMAIDTMEDLSYWGSYAYGDSGAWGLSANGLVIFGIGGAGGSPYKYNLSTSTASPITEFNSKDNTYTNGISADGSVIVGTMGGKAFKYTDSGGTEDLGSFGGSHSYADGVSGDGSIIVGASFLAAGGYHAYRYTTATGMVDLGTLCKVEGCSSEADAISADGSTIVGSSQYDRSLPFTSHIFKYTASGGMVDLGSLGDGLTAHATLVSANGSVIAGVATADATPGSYKQHAIKYTAATGIVDMGTLGGDNSNVKAMSADGSVIVGQSDTATAGVKTAYKYSNGVMTSLGTLGGKSAMVYSLSRSGKVIVGDSLIAGDKITHAFKYINGAMIDLGTLGGTYSSAQGVSADGSIIVGESSLANGTTHAFVYRNSTIDNGATPAPTIAPFSFFPSFPPSSNNNLIDINNTQTALNMSGYQLSAVMNLQNNLLSAGLNRDCAVFSSHGTCVSVGGAYSNVNNGQGSDSSVSLNAAYQLMPSLRVGAFIDQSVANSTPNNYHLSHQMPLLGLFAAWAPEGQGLGPQLKASVAYSQRDVDITRVVLDHTEAGTGSTKLTTKGAQLEGAWGLALSDDWVAQPFAGVRVSEVKRDAYAEGAGVDFPITYNAVTQTASTAYLGARFLGQLTEKLAMNVSAGVEEDFRNKVSAQSGTINTLGDFSLDAPHVLHTRGFASASLNYAVAPMQYLSAAVFANQNALNHATGVTAMANYMIGF